MDVCSTFLSFSCVSSHNSTSSVQGRGSKYSNANAILPSASTDLLFPVIHAEMPVTEPGKPEPRGLQLWVDLPQQYKMAEPSYQDLEPEK